MSFASRVTYISTNPATLTYAFSFTYIDASYVKVYFNSVLQTGVTVTTGQVALTTGAAIGVEVLIQRETPTTALVDFVDGAVLTENDLDSLTIQALHVSVEAKDDSVDGLQLNAAGDAYDANNKQIENLAAPLVNGDAARFDETDALDTRVTAAEASITLLEGTDPGHAMVTDGSNRFDAESRLIKNTSDGVDAQDAATRNQIDTLTVRRTLATNDFLADSKRIKNLADPINGTDAANKDYVDSVGGGGGGLSNVVEDTTPQLGGQLDVNGNAIGDGTLEILKFGETASAVNEVTVTNAATAGSPSVTATGDDVNIDLTLDGKGSGTVKTLSSDLDITGDIIVTGTVDGRDVATDGTKLDGVEALADVTDATNVNAAGAVMESDFTPAHSLMVQQSGTGSPAPLSVGTNTIVGRVSGGGSAIDALTPTEVRSLINVADGAEVNPTVASVLTIDTGTNNTEIVSPLGLAGSQLQTDVTANNAKVTNATHTGDVTGDTALTIAADAIDTAMIANLQVTGAKIANSTVTFAKIANMADDTVMGNVSGGLAAPSALSVAQLRTLIGFDEKLQPKAFCTFNPGATGFAEEANAYNIASITRTAAGDYTINFTTAMATATYSVQLAQGDSSNTPHLVGFDARTTGSVRVFIKNAGGSLTDNPEDISVTIHSYV